MEEALAEWLYFPYKKRVPALHLTSFLTRDRRMRNERVIAIAD